MNKKTFIWGGKKHLRVSIPLLKRIERRPDYVYDPYIEKINFEISGIHFKDESLISNYAKECDACVVAIGDGERRCEVANILLHKFNLPNLDLIHEKSYLCETSRFESGLMMMPGSIVNSFTVLGKNCIVNTNSSVDHDCILGDGVHVMGGASIAGSVQIENYATIGTNSTILPGLKIGEGSYIGAGAVVTKNIPPRQIVVGVPARPYIKS